MCDAGDVEHRAIVVERVKAGMVAERTFAVQLAQVHVAFQYNFGIRGHLDIRCFALHHLDRTPTQKSGDHHFIEVRRQRCPVEPQPLEEHRESLTRRHLAVIDGAQALGFLPRGLERSVALLERHLRRRPGQHRVQVAGGRAHPAPADLDLRQPITLEAHERVEEIEEDGAVGHLAQGLQRVTVEADHEAVARLHERPAQQAGLLDHQRDELGVADLLPVQAERLVLGRARGEQAAHAVGRAARQGANLGGAQRLLEQIASGERHLATGEHRPPLDAGGSGGLLIEDDVAAHSGFLRA